MVELGACTLLTNPRGLEMFGEGSHAYVLGRVMRHGYERAALLALIAVLIFVFADFRNLRDALLATIPLVSDRAWLLEAMGALGWEFDLANPSLSRSSSYARR